MKRITVTYLTHLGACPDQVAIVEREWPAGAPIMTASIHKAYQLGLDVEWLARKVLDAPVWAEYERVRAPAWAKYTKVRAPALAEYKNVKDERVRAPALAEYMRVKAPALAEYEKVTTQALAPLLCAALTRED